MKTFVMGNAISAVLKIDLNSHKSIDVHYISMSSSLEKIEIPCTGKTVCPICLKNTDLWKAGTTETKRIVLDNKVYTIHNLDVICISYDGRPVTSGKIMTYRYGKIINNIIEEHIKETGVVGGYCELNLINTKFNSITKFPNFSSSTIKSILLF